MTIVAGMPRRRAASATPCAWLPAEAQITPRWAMVSERCAILLYAPRSLNENTGCRSSRLNSTVLPRRRLKRRRVLERRLDRDVVHARLENAFEILVRHAVVYGNRKAPAPAIIARHVLHPAPPMTDTNSSLTRRDLLTASAGVAAAAALRPAPAGAARAERADLLARAVAMGAHATGAGPAARLPGCRERRPDAARRHGSRISGTRGAEHRHGRRGRDAGPRRPAAWQRALRPFFGCDPDELLFTRGAGEALGQASRDSTCARRRSHHDHARTSCGAQPVADAGAAPRDRRQADRAADAADRPGAGARAVRRRGDRAHQGARVLPRAIRRRRGAAGARSVRVRAPARHSHAWSMARRRWACSISPCATSAAISMRPASTSGWAAVMAPVCCTCAARCSIGCGRSSRAASTRAAGVHADGRGRQRSVPAALHKFGNIVPYAWPALRGVEAALEFQQQVGRGKIEARIRELAIYARLRLQQLPGIELLTPARPGLWAGILTFRVPGKSAPDLATAVERTHRVYVARCAGRRSERRAALVAARLQHARRRRQARPGPAASTALTWI